MFLRVINGGRRILQVHTCSTLRLQAEVFRNTYIAVACRSCDNQQEVGCQQFIFASFSFFLWNVCAVLPITLNGSWFQTLSAAVLSEVIASLHFVVCLPLKQVIGLIPLR
jgi:hypothetical protein